MYILWILLEKKVIWLFCVKRKKVKTYPHWFSTNIMVYLIANMRGTQHWISYWLVIAVQHVACFVQVFEIHTTFSLFFIFFVRSVKYQNIFVAIIILCILYSPPPPRTPNSDNWQLRRVELTFGEICILSQFWV